MSSMSVTLFGGRFWIDCCPRDALAAVRGLGSKFGPARRVPVALFRFLLRRGDMGLVLLDLLGRVETLDISLSDVSDMASGHDSNCRFLVCFDMVLMPKNSAHAP